MKYLLLLSLFAVGCARSDQSHGVRIFTNVNPQLEEFFVDFEYETGHSAANITGGFTTLGSNYAGMCYYTDNGNEVRFDTAYWQYLSYDQKKQLVYHELGHCALGLGHIDTLSADGMKLSIMHSEAFDYSMAIYMQYRINDYVYALVHGTVIQYP